MNRSLWVDYAKAIGIILVVYGHVTRGIYNAGININETIYNLADSIVYTFHMPLFFFLSGLFFYNSFQKKGAKKLIFSKVDTIVYPYLIWSIIQGLLEVSLTSYTNGNDGYSNILSLLWLPRAQFWFLYSLFIIFVITSLAFNKLNIKCVTALFIGTSALYLIQTHLLQVFQVNSVANNLVFFVFGILITRHSDSKFLNSNKLFPAMLALFIISQYVFHVQFSLTYADKSLLTLIIALISILLVVAASKSLETRFNDKIKWLLFIGSSSMAIFLMHIIAASGVRIILHKILGIESASLHIIIGCITGVCLPLIAVIVINKLKIPFVFSMPISKFFNKHTAN